MDNNSNVRNEAKEEEKKEKTVEMGKERECGVSVDNRDIHVSGNQYIASTINLNTTETTENLPGPSVSDIATEFQKEFKDIVRTSHSTYNMPGSNKKRNLLDHTVDVTLRKKSSGVLLDVRRNDDSIKKEKKAGEKENMPEREKVKTNKKTVKKKNEKQFKLSESDSEFDSESEIKRKSTKSRKKIVKKVSRSRFKSESDSDSESEYGSESSYDSDTGVKQCKNFPRNSMVRPRFESEPESEPEYGSKIGSPLLEKTTYNMSEFIAKIENNSDYQQFLIVASGGKGKTITSKLLMLLWALGKFQRDFFGVIRLEMRNINTGLNIFQNMVSQYPGIATKFANVIQKLENLFQESQEKFIWILDGLDEVLSLHETELWLVENHQRFRQSPFIIFSRLDGKIMLSEFGDEFLEFTLCELENHEYKEYIRKYPFTDSSKQLQLLNDCETNSAIRAAEPIPFYMATFCILYNDESYSVKIRNELDIHQALAGMAIKAAEIKIIQNYLKGDKDTKKVKDSLLKNRDKIFKKSPEQFFMERQDVLVNLGKVLIEINGFSVTYQQGVDKESLMQILERERRKDDEIKVILQLNIYEERTIEKEDGSETVILEFHHRDVQEYIKCLYLSQNESGLELAKKTSRFLKDTHLSILRCATALLLRALKVKQNGIDPEQFKKRMLIIIQQIMNSCEIAAPWRIAQIVCDLYQAYITVPQTKPVIPNLVCTLVHLMRDNNPFDIEMNETNCSYYLKVIASHYHYNHENCAKCHPPPIDKYHHHYKVPNSIKEPDSEETNNWPDNKNFIVQPLLVKKEDFISMSFLHEGEEHATQQTYHRHFKSPTIIDADLPIPFVMSDIPTNDVRPSKGMYFAFAAAIQGRMLILFEKENKKLECWSLNPLTDTFAIEEMKGNFESGVPSWASSFHFVPSLFSRFHFVVDGATLYFLDSYDESKAVELYAYDGFVTKWDLVEVEGPKPSPRRRPCAWSYEGDLFLYAGYLPRPPSASELRGGETESGRSNEIIRFTRSTRRWSYVETLSRRPKKRSRARCAVLNGKVYVYGGDFLLVAPDKNIWIFDMTTSAWTEIELNLSPPLEYISLTTIDDRYLLIVSAEGTDSADRTWIFDTKKRRFFKTNPLMIEKKSRCIDLNFLTVLFGKHVYVFDDHRICTKIQVRR